MVEADIKMRGGASLGEAGRGRRNNVELGWARFADEGFAVAESDAVGGCGERQSDAERRGRAQHGFARAIDAGRHEAADVAAIAGTGRTVEPGRDSEGFAHAEVALARNGSDGRDSVNHCAG